MNRALVAKAIGDSWLHLAVSCVLLFVFGWVFVWLMSQLPANAFGVLLKWMNFLKPILQVPVEALATRTGQISVIYVHVVTLLVCVGWALGRGSHSISGEVSRGTLDLLLSLPVWRLRSWLPRPWWPRWGAALLVARACGAAAPWGC